MDNFRWVLKLAASIIGMAIIYLLAVRVVALIGLV